MKTQKEIEKEIEKVKIECWSSVQSSYPTENRKRLYEFKLTENWSHYLELKALLQQSKEFVEMIENKKPKYCPFCVKDYGTCECKEDIMLKEIRLRLEELKSSLIGNKEK